MIDRRPDRYAQAVDMIPQMSRRALLAAAALTLPACGKAEAAYFGKTDPPKSQRLAYLIRLLVQHVAGHPGLHVDQGEVVADHVVQVAGDP